MMYYANDNKAAIINDTVLTITSFHDNMTTLSWCQDDVFLKILQHYYD
jgi:hypothetical protein